MATRKPSRKKAQKMPKKVPFKKTTAVEEVDEIEEVDDVEDVEETPEPPKVTVTTTEAPLAAVKVAVAVDDKLVEVTPRINLPRCSIGGSWYSFRKGHSTRVPADVARILSERDIV